MSVSFFWDTVYMLIQYENECAKKLQSIDFFSLMHVLEQKINSEFVNALPIMLYHIYLRNIHDKFELQADVMLRKSLFHSKIEMLLHTQIRSYLYICSSPMPSMYILFWR